MSPRDINTYGPCPTCGNMFQSRTSKVFCGLGCYIRSEQFSRQADLFRKRAGEYRARAAEPRKIRLVKDGKTTTRTCHNCGKVYTSPRSQNLKYCSRNCYQTSPEFIERIVARNKAGSRRVEYECMECSKKWFGKPSKKSRFCSRRHYRDYMAKRFDRWIASPETIALPQNFDEFLTKEELPCLIRGCTWSGVHLGAHVNFAHGISALEFKKLAGFNIGTGLVTPELSNNIASRPHLAFIAQHPENLIHDARGKYVSLESIEHGAKGRSLSLHSFSPVERICGQCGKTFTQQIPFGMKKYCSIRCRTKRYSMRRCCKRSSEICEFCKISFSASLDQIRRKSSGFPIYCSKSCATKANRSR